MRLDRKYDHRATNPNCSGQFALRWLRQRVFGLSSAGSETRSAHHSRASAESFPVNSVKYKREWHQANPPPVSCAKGYDTSMYLLMHIQ